MKITWTEEKIGRVDADLIAVPFRRDEKNPAFDALDRATRKALSAMAETEQFKGQEDRTLIWQGRFSGRLRKIMVLGVGAGETGPDRWRLAVAKSVRHASAHRLPSLAVFIDDLSDERQAKMVRWTAEAITLAVYRFKKYKTKTSLHVPPKAGLIGVFPAAHDGRACKKAITRGKAAAAGVVLARDLTNEPANVLSPRELADRARDMAERRGLECTILDEDAIRKKGMNLLLSVAAGSNREPCLIHLVYRPKKTPKARVAFVGKGVMFDSGGLCVKPGKSMYTMKTDMAGAGVVLGICSALRTFAPDVEVHGIIPATDNSIGSDATRPGDIVKSMDGLTVEILNTDAEGRLILADALTYAARLDPSAIIDHATLTGACLAALGSVRAGLFASTEVLSDQYLRAARRAGELLWRLPLSPELEKDIRSDVADIKNIGGQYGGAITAALFLKRFVKKTPWIHLDIAGPARAEKSTPLCPQGGSGFGVLTGLEYLLALTTA